MAHVTRQSVTAVLLTLMLIGSVIPAAAAVGSQPALNHEETTEEPSEEPDDGMDPADEIFVKDNGDAVLVSEEDEGASDDSTTELGIDVGENLMYMLVTEPAENTEARGQASLSLTDSAFNGEGHLTVPQPEQLTDFSMDLSGESTSENAESSLSIDTTFQSGGASLLKTASTDGTITSTGTSLTAEGSIDSTLNRQSASRLVTAESASYSLTETDGSYTVDVSRNVTVSPFEAEDWNTRAKAKATVQENFQTTATQYNGSATVTISQYTYTNVSDGPDRLDISYTVEYDGLEPTVTKLLAQQLVSSSEVDIDKARADELAAQMEALTINDLSASYSASAESVTADFSADIDNYDQVVLAALEIANATDDSEMMMTTDIDRLRSQIEAQKAADLTQEFSWSGEVTKPGPASVSVSFSADSTSENWGAYVTELNERDIPVPELTYEFSGSSDGDRINVSGNMELEGSLLDQMTGQMESAAQDDPESAKYLTAFMDADLQKSKVDMSITEDTVRFEAGAQFANLSSLFSTFAAEDETFPSGVTSIVARPENGTTKTYVTVDGAVGSDATKDDVKALAYVDSETIIHMPGEWDREFPTMDTDRASEFLGVDSGSAANTTTASESGPGFSAVAALVALLALALVAGRRD